MRTMEPLIAKPPASRTGCLVRRLVMILTSLIALASGLALAGTDRRLAAAPALPASAITSQSWLADPHNAFTPRQTLGQSWTPFEGVLARGYVRGTTWLRLRIDPRLAGPGTLPTDQRIALRIEPDHLDEVVVIDPTKGEQVLATVGDTTKPLTQPHRWLGHTVVIPDAAEPFELLLRVRSQGAHSVQVRALRWDQARDLDLQSIQHAWVFLMFSAAVVLWSALVWLGRPDRLLILFIANQLAAIGVVVTQFGLLRLWAVDWVAPALIDQLSVGMVAVYALLNIMFHVVMAPDLGARMPERNWVRWLMVQPALGLLLVLAGARQLGLQLSVSTAMVAMPIMVVVAWRSGGDPLDGATTVGRWRRAYLVGTYLAMNALTMPQVLTVLGLRATDEANFEWFLTYAVLSALLMGGLLRYRALRIERQGREMAQALAKARQQEQLHRARAAEQSDLVTMLVHELKTPLSVVNLALGPSAQGSFKRERALRSVSSMRDVIDRCAQIARMDQLADEVDSSPSVQPVDLKLVLEESVALMTQGDRVDRVITESSLVCSADPQMVQLVLNNLLDNALKYSPPASRVSVVLEPAQRGGRPGVALQVINAVGRAGRPEPQNLFEKYHRGALARYRSGTGLGLYLSHRLVERMGGTIALLETEDVRFELWMPRDQPALGTPP